MLTAGGFVHNFDMLKSCCPSAYRGAAATYTGPSDTGECTRMALGVGADMAGFDSFKFFDGGIAAYEEGEGDFYHYLYSGDNQVSRQPWLAIDKNGKRYGYVSSAMDSPDMVSALEDQAFMEISQIGGRSYVIFDDNWEENVPKFQQGGCRYPITVHDPSELTHVPEYYHIGSWTDGVRKSLESGVIKSADSIEELADKLSLERDVLTGAVDHWNELCAQGEDTDLTYYPYKSEWLIPISQPPYHGIKIGGMLSVTECGVRVQRPRRQCPGVGCYVASGGSRP